MYDGLRRQIGCIRPRLICLTRGVSSRVILWASGVNKMRTLFPPTLGLVLNPPRTVFMFRCLRTVVPAVARRWMSISVAENDFCDGPGRSYPAVSKTADAAGAQQSSPRARTAGTMRRGDARLR